jgi:hypothetical protein
MPLLGGFFEERVKIMDERDYWRLCDELSVFRIWHGIFHQVATIVTLKACA